MKQEAEHRKIVYCPVPGEVIPLKETPDEVFAGGALGSGAAVRPKDSVIRAPFDGQVSMIFDTGHAIGLCSRDGIELLIHIGMNTAELKGAYFEVLVKEGAAVKLGQPLISFDAAALQKLGYDLTTPVVITNSNVFFSVLRAADGFTAAGDVLLAADPIPPDHT